MPATAAADEVGTVVEQFLHVVEAGDTEAFLHLFTTAGQVDDWGRVFTGREQIRAWSAAEFIGADGHLSDVHIETTAATATIVAQWSSRRHNGPSRFVLHVRGGRLQSMIITEA